MAYGGETDRSHKNAILEHLNCGKEVIIHVIGPEYEKGPGMSPYTNSQHWMVLLDYNSLENQVYVSNPNKNGENGWLDVDKVLTSLEGYYLIGPGKVKGKNQKWRTDLPY